MKTVCMDEIHDALRLAGIEGQKHLFVQSSLFNLGVIKDRPVSQIPEDFFAALRNVAGPESNVYMPAFNYSYPKTRFADLRYQETEVGVLPEWLRIQDGVVRSGHPMFSICGYGPKAASICKPHIPEYNCFSPDSTFSRLIDSNALLVLQGVGIPMATIVVQCEARLGVKYRFLKPFHGQVILSNGIQVEGDFFHFCFPLNNEYRQDFTQLESALMASGKIKKVALGMSFVFAVELQDLCRQVKLLLDEDPFALLAKTPKNYYRYENGREVPYPIFHDGN